MSFPFFFDGTSNIVIGGSMGIGTTISRRSLDVIGETYTTSAFVSSNLGIGTTITLTRLEVHSTDGVLLPRGSTVQRPTPTLRGYIRYNTDTDQFEGYGAANNWGSLGGVKSTDQTTYISAELTAGANDSNLRFYNGNSLNMIVNPLGNVGIGTSQPLYKLDVVGSVNATNYFGNASGLCNITSQLMWITGGGLRVANQKLVVDGDLFVGGNIYGACNTSIFTGGGTVPSLITPNVVTSSNIVDRSITFAKLDPSAYNFQWMILTEGGLRTNQKVVVDGDLIVGGNIYNASNVNLNDLYPGGAILGCNISVGAVTSSNIVDGSITFAKLDASAYNFQWMAVTGGGLRTSQKVIIDGDLVLGGNIISASNENLNNTYPGGAVLGCNIGVGVINTSNLVDYAVTIPKIDFSSNLPVVFGGSVGIGTTLITATGLTVDGSASIGAYTNIVAPADSLIVSGNVGIGTTTPQTKLDVNGTIKGKHSIGVGQHYMLTADRTLAAITAGTEQAIFNQSFNADANTWYSFEIMVYLTTGTSATNYGFRFSTGTSLTYCVYDVIYNNAAAGGTGAGPFTGMFVTNPAIAGSYISNPGSTAASRNFIIRGSILTNAAGTIVPNVTFSANPGGTNIVKTGSFARFIAGTVGSSTLWS